MLDVFVKVGFCSDKEGLNSYSLFYVQKIQSMVNISHNIWKLFIFPTLIFEQIIYVLLHMRM